MKARLKLLALSGLTGLALCMPLAARADDENDHNLALELYEQGDIHSLNDILKGLRQKAPGDVVGVELIRLGDKWVYRFQVVAADGRRTTIDIDAGAPASIHQGGDD